MTKRLISGILLPLLAMPAFAYKDWYYALHSVYGEAYPSPPGVLWFSPPLTPTQCSGEFYGKPVWTPYVFLVQCVATGQANVTLRVDHVNTGVEGECMIPVADEAWATDLYTYYIPGYNNRPQAVLGLQGTTFMSVTLVYQYNQIQYCIPSEGCWSNDDIPSTSQPCA